MPQLRQSRRNKRAAALRERLERYISEGTYSTLDELWLAKIEIATLDSLYTEEQMNEPEKNQIQEAIASESLPARKRRAYAGEDNERPIMKLNKQRLYCALSWYFGIWPKKKEINNIRANIGEFVFDELDEALYPLMAMKDWTEEQKTEVTETIDKFNRGLWRPPDQLELIN